MKIIRSAFTLVEILIVIGILALLAAILLPALATAREKGRDSVCLTNLRQIGNAMALYVSDYDGVYPPAVGESGDWLQLILPKSSIETLPRCPDAQFPASFDQKKEFNAVVGYAYNSNLPDINPLTNSPQGKDGQIRYPASTVLACDARAGIYSINGADTGNPEDDYVASLLTYPSGIHEEILALPEGGRRHSEGANYVLIDGHTKWLKPDQVQGGHDNDGKRIAFGL